jgi:hypothetical protein
MWPPNKQQWGTIAVAAIIAVAGIALAHRYAPLFVTIAVLLGGLLFWSQGDQGNSSARERSNR